MKKSPRSAARPATESGSDPSRLHLIFGEDDYRVEQSCRKLLDNLFPEGIPEMGLEVIEGRASNQSEGLKILDRLFEALNTMAFFSAEKVVWLKNTNLFAESHALRAQALQDRIGDFSGFLKESGLPDKTTLLISAEAVDARKSFYKVAEKHGNIITFKHERPEETARETRRFVETELRARKVSVTEDALDAMIFRSSGDFRLLGSEIEKISNYVGSGGKITAEHVELVGSSRPSAVVWDLTGAFDRRDTEKVLRILSQLQYQKEAAIGLLFALISHIRQLLFLREFIERGILKSPSNPGHLSAQISRISSDIRAELPQDKKWNPLLGNPYALFHRMKGAEAYSARELRLSMAALLKCNERMVTSSNSDYYWLENAMLKIMAGAAAKS